MPLSEGRDNVPSRVFAILQVDSVKVALQRTIRGELGIAEKIEKDINVVGLLNHISSQGGISGLLKTLNIQERIWILIGSKK